MNFADNTGNASNNRKKIKISVIVAFSKKGRIIGSKGKLPWNLPEDLKHFKEITSGNAVIMGRKTFESIGRPLPNRLNIVVTRNKSLKIQGAKVAESPEKAIEIAMANNLDQIFICGGQQIYEATLKYADNIFATEIHGDFKGDAFFPEIDMQKFTEIGRKKHWNSKNGTAWDFAEYQKLNR